MRGEAFMRCSVVLLCAVSFALSQSVLWAQVESPQARQLRAQLEEIQQRLDQLRRTEGGNQNVTEIGSSRGRVRSSDEPRLVVRIYDISELFSIAPSYPAREPSDLQDSARAVFPELKTAGAG